MLAANLRQARIAKNLTQEQLADLLDVPRTRLSAWEIGRTKVDVDMLPKLCEILEVSYEFLFGTHFDREAADLPQPVVEFARRFALLNLSEQEMFDRMISALIREKQELVAQKMTQKE